MPKIGAVIEARTASTRLPGKVLLDLMPGHAMIDVVVGRARAAQRLDTVIVATSVNASDDALAQHCADKGYPVFRGSEEDVMGRVLSAAQEHGLDWLVRLTGDNPFIEGELIDDLCDFCIDGGFDYAATTMMGHSENWNAERTFPRGISLEVVRLSALETVASETTDPALREFTTFALYDEAGRWQLGAFSATGKYAGWAYPDLRFTVDTEQDLELARSIFDRLGGGDPLQLRTADVIALVAGDEDLSSINADVQHNVVSKMNLGAN